jgi:hypothetical protein
MGGHASVNGVKVTQVTMATSDQDQGARPTATAAFGVLKYTPVRDIALLKLSEPLSRTGMRAVPFYTGDLQPGQSVTALGYPGGNLEAIRGKYVEECDEGELQFELSQEVFPGISGGLILDERGRAIGLIYGISPTNAKMIYAVPVWSIAEFLHVASPEVYANVFGGDGLSDGDLSMPEPPTSTGGKSGPQSVLPESLLRRSDERPTAAVMPNDETPVVKALRTSAQDASEQMDNFIARQTLHFSSGKEWQHEVQLVNGAQRLRTIGAGKEITDLPSTRRGPVPGSEWSDLVTTIAFDRDVTVQFEADITVEGKIVKAFRYEVSAGDEICQLRVSRAFRREWKGSPPSCGGSVWTDEEFRILRITKETSMFPQNAGGVAEFRIVIQYGWWGERLVPAKMYLQSTLRNGKSQESTAKFDNYREFAVSSRVVSAESW